MTTMSHTKTLKAPMAKAERAFDLDAEKAIYAKQLLDPRWRDLRALVLRRDANRCRCCGATSALQVHHRQYHTRPDGRWIAPWQYATRLLITYCASCHEAGHERNGKTPTFKLPR